MKSTSKSEQSIDAESVAHSAGRPILTVILPTYNSELYVAETIESVLRQSLQRLELLVIDDNSSDRTVNIVNEFQRNDRRVNICVLPDNRGAGSARNVGLDGATGEYVAFLDSDDVWHLEKSAKQIAAMRRCHADISFTGYERFKHGSSHSIRVQVPDRVTYATMLRRNYIACSTAIVRRSTCGTHRMPEIRRRQDHGYWLSLLRDNTRTAVGVNEPLVRYRLHRESLSANKLIAAQYSWRLLREVESFGIAKSVWLFSGYAFEAVKIRLQGAFSGAQPINEDGRKGQ